MASLDLRPSTPQPAPLRVVKRSTRRIPSGASSLARSRLSSGESTSIDKRIESPAYSFGHEQILSVRKRGQPKLTPRTNRAPAFRRLLRPERSFVKLPTAPARHKSRIQSNGESPTLMGATAVRTARPSPQPVWLGAQGLPPPPSVTYDGNGAICSPRFPPPGVSGYGQTLRLAEPKVLVPHITITPEVQAIERVSDMIWVAVEVSGRVVTSDEPDDVLPVVSDAEGDHPKRMDTGVFRAASDSPS